MEHGAYLTSEGVMFTFGKDRYGQLGHGFESCKEPVGFELSLVAS